MQSHHTETGFRLGRDEIEVLQILLNAQANV